ncbi:MAG: uracil-DNA glycosylase [Methanobacteriota archaeon]|nr:MAG: uracil-DNA glycosylase [Euryarchaeota archaeon]
MDGLVARICNCTKCPLAETRNTVVVGRGNKEASLMFIGEAPGAKEDETGLPFVGKAGTMLSTYLSSVGIDESSIYIANILKCRPPNNRNPKKDEIEMCTPWLVGQIREISPKIICTLGNYATKFILAKGNIAAMSTIDGISSLHGKPINMELFSKELIVFPLYHPAAIIYNRALNDAMERDMLELAKLHKETVRGPVS